MRRHRQTAGEASPPFGPPFPPHAQTNTEARTSPECALSGARRAPQHNDSRLPNHRTTAPAFLGIIAHFMFSALKISPSLYILSPPAWAHPFTVRGKAFMHQARAYFPISVQPNKVLAT